MSHSIKKSEKDAYFRLLGYSALLGPRIEPVGEAVKIKRTQEIKEAYNKLFNFNCSGS